MLKHPTWHHHACDRQRAQRASLDYLQYLVNSGLFSPGRLSQASARVPAVRLLAARAAVDGAPPKMPCSQVPLEKKVDDLLGLFVEYQIEQSRRDCRALVAMPSVPCTPARALHAQALGCRHSRPTLR